MNKNIYDAESFQGKILPSDEDTLETLRDSVQLIIQGPEEDNKMYFVQAALSDLHTLLEEAKIELVSKKDTPKDQFPRKFAQSTLLAERTKVSERKLFLCLKKLEYYLSWANAQKEFS